MTRLSDELAQIRESMGAIMSSFAASVNAHSPLTNIDIMSYILDFIEPEHSQGIAATCHAIREIYAKRRDRIKFVRLDAIHNFTRCSNFISSCTSNLALITSLDELDNQQRLRWARTGARMTSIVAGGHFIAHLEISFKIGDAESVWGALSSLPLLESLNLSVVYRDDDQPVVPADSLRLLSQNSPFLRSVSFSRIRLPHESPVLAQVRELDLVIHLGDRMPSSDSSYTIDACAIADIFPALTKLSLSHSHVRLPTEPESTRLSLKNLELYFIDTDEASTLR